MLTFDQIITDIRNKVFSPVYFLYGEEPFYIDQLTDFIEDNAIDDDVKEFNQSVVYGRDVTAQDVIDLARRFPMMGNYQVVIVKEAQGMEKIEELEPYLGSVLTTTILVVAYKYKKLDKRKSFYKSLSKSKDAVVFHSEKLREHEIPSWIEKMTITMGYSINPMASRLLSEYLGNDLEKIHNELEKLAINLEKGSKITEVEIEQNIGISKDFNVFEFQNALAKRNALKAQQIVQYFEDNPKDHPLQMISVMLHNYFIKVYLYHHIKGMQQREIAAELGVHPFFVKDYTQAAKAFSPQKIKSVISQIKQLDLKSKGVGSLDASGYGELKELVFKIIH